MATILFCEDEATIRNLLAAVMRGSQHTIAITANAEVALRSAAEAWPDLLVTDQQLDRTATGADLVQSLREMAAGRSAPRVIFMTGALCREDLEIINSVDPTLIIRKPFSIQNLREAVERALTPEPSGWLVPPPSGLRPQGPDGIAPVLPHS
ncbi:MAG TPA: response regulator [Candidatus Acidoferrales bacterium]|nr:response regulator [Candidatus Acidoferrales bacterium]